ncbi:MAG: hypothetical protein ACJ71S_14165, partial [Acidobacteriaceae bacterium]
MPKPSHLVFLCALALFLSASPVCMGAQAPANGPQQGMSGGVNTGGTFAPVLDAQKRPITAGGFVDHGPT